MDAKKKMEKVQVKVQLSPEARDRLQQICSDRGMIQVAVITRLVDWFAKQGNAVQAIVLEQVTETHVLEAILRAEIDRRGAGDAAEDDQLGTEVDAGMQGRQKNLPGRKKAS